MSGNGEDDAAIGAIDDSERTVRMISVPLQVAPEGRPVIVQVPTDITPIEVIALIGFLTTELGAFIRANDPQQAARARLILPT